MGKAKEDGTPASAFAALRRDESGGPTQAERKEMTMKRTQSRVGIMALALAFLAAPIATPADELRIQSFDNTGTLTFNRIPTGQAYRVECATSLTGVWTRLTNAVTVDGIPTTMDCIPGPGKGGIVTGAVPVQASSMFFRAVAETNDMVLIPAGTFVMGATHETGGDDLPQHLVYVSAFYMNRYKVTLAEWDSVCTWATNRAPDLKYQFTCGGGKGPTHPVLNLSWIDAVAWCNARSEMEGLTPCYTNANGSVYRTGGAPEYHCNWAANGYRLPTEAEWEKAARGGVSGHRFPWSDADTIQHTRANYQARTNVYSFDTSATSKYHPAYTNGWKPYTSPVGAFAPNGYGLYDMAGNATEWCWDFYSGTYYTTSPRIDPRGALKALSAVDEKVYRAGNSQSLAPKVESSSRGKDQPHSAQPDGGLRTVRVLVPPVSNQAPVIAEGASVNVILSEDSAPTPFSLTLHATDADGDAIGWWVLTPASHGTATEIGSGTSLPVVYQPGANFNGSDSFVMQAYDPWGAKTSITVNVTIQPVNDAPVANAQFVSVAINTPQAITLTGSDIEGSELTYAVVDQPTHGALSGTPPNVTYTPFLNYKGSDSFTFEVNDGTADSLAPATVTLWMNAMAAQGGTMTNYTANGTNYTAHIFTTVGSASLVVSSGGSVEVLLVAGGGGGGGAFNTGGGGGGGGAGGLIYTNLILVAGPQAVTVGAGGVAGSWYSDTATQGANSTIAGLTALGGGRGKFTDAGTSGGSGAGGHGKGYAGGAGSQTNGYGNSGGVGGPNPGGGGGGGGAGSAGSAGVTNSVGGNGGAGRSYDISGVLTGYAGGGGGGAQVGSGGTATDGGGQGGTSGISGGVAGAPNTGGGGGGGTYNSSGAAGGSGIVIVRYGIAVP
jgi:formylglycine-generating enzyme required for sulfatase activity